MTKMQKFHIFLNMQVQYTLDVISRVSMDKILEALRALNPIIIRGVRESV